MSAQLLQSGLNLANYLQSAFPPEPAKDPGVPNEFERTSPRPSQPGALVRPLIDSGRFYFRLSYQEAVSNLLSLFAPIGKVRPLVPDLYIPTVSICTFLLLRSIYIVLYTDTQPNFGDILRRTVIRICLVFVVEILVLSGLLYATFPLVSPLDGMRLHTTSTDGSVRSGHVSPPYGVGSDRDFGASSNPFSHYGGHEGAHNQVSSPFGQYAGNVGAPRGMMDGSYGVNAPNFGNMGTAKAFEPDVDGKYLGDNMSLSAKDSLHLPEKLFIIGYKYVLLNCYILAILIAPIKAVTMPLAAYICVTSVMFSLRTVNSLNGAREQKARPLMFIFPILQPVCCYILLPHI